MYRVMLGIVEKYTTQFAIKHNWSTPDGTTSSQAEVVSLCGVGVCITQHN